MIAISISEQSDWLRLRHCELTALPRQQDLKERIRGGEKRRESWNEWTEKRMRRDGEELGRVGPS